MIVTSTVLPSDFKLFIIATSHPPPPPRPIRRFSFGRLYHRHHLHHCKCHRRRVLFSMFLT